MLNPDSKLFHKHELERTNRAAQVAPNKNFSVLMASLSRESREEVREQVVPAGLVDPGWLKDSTLATRKVLGVVDEYPEIKKVGEECVRFSPTLSSAMQEREVIKTADMLKLGHLLAQQQ